MELIFKNGKINRFRNKLNNEHLDVDNNYLNENKYEIYSVVDDNGFIMTIGDINDNGIISDFFTTESNEIFIRFAIVLKDQNHIKIKKNCVKL